MDTGFITLHRKILDNPIWKNSQLSHLLLTLLLLANHEEKKTLFNGKIEVIKRGQLITGRFSLSEVTGIPPGSIWKYLQLLKSLEIISTKSSNKFSLITIVKYSDYQDIEGVYGSKGSNRVATKKQQSSTNNHDNNDNNETIIQGEAPNEINQLLGFFKESVNPHIPFNNKTERKAAEDLINAYGLDKVKSAMGFLQQRRKTDKFLPIITTPYQLFTKWAAIKQHLETKKPKIWKPNKMSPPLSSLPTLPTK